MEQGSVDCFAPYYRPFVRIRLTLESERASFRSGGGRSWQIPKLAQNLKFCKQSRTAGVAVAAKPTNAWGDYMKKLVFAATAALSVAFGAQAASATTLTFDDLTGSGYGSGEGYPMLSNMAFDGSTLTYTSGDYILSFAGGEYSHFGDGSSVRQTFNWHNHPDNSDYTVVSLARVDGAAFDLSSFDYSSDLGFEVSADGYDSVNLASGSGTSLLNFNNVQSVSFFGNGFANQLDNIEVNAAAVPEPASWAMMVGGFGLIGGALRRKKAAVSFA